MKVEPVERHSAPVWLVITSLLVSGTVGSELAGWLELEGILSWLVIGVTCVVGFLAIGMAYGFLYSRYAEHMNRDQ